MAVAWLRRLETLMARFRAFSLATRVSGALAAMISLVPGVGAARQAAGEATPPNIAIAEAPVAWVRYAEVVTAKVSAWLAEESAPSTRLRAYLDQARPSDDKPAPPVLLRLWISREGTVERLEFTPFAHEEPNADLRAALVGRALTPPPADMLLPLRIEVQSAPSEGAAPEPG